MSDAKTPEEHKKKLARAKINNALRDGRLKKPSTCRKCGKHTSKLTAHHTSGYSKNGERKVIWICYHCHKIETDKSHGRSRVSGQKGKGH